MKALLTFPNVSFIQQDGDTVNVKVNEAFEVDLQGAPEGLTWVASKDKVLDVYDDGTNAAINALDKGTSRVLLLDANDQPQFRLTFVVFDPEEGASFDVPDPVTEPIQ